MRFLMVKAWGKLECERTPGKRSFYWRCRAMGTIHSHARGRRGVGTAAGAVHNDIDGRGGGTAMDVCRHAVPHAGSVSSCHRLGHMTHLSFAQGKPHRISAWVFVRNS